MDSSEPKQRGAMASPEGIVLPQFLAAWPSFLAAAEPAEVGARKAVAAAIVDGAECHVMRVLLNPTGTLCYANSVVLALGWLTLLTDNLDPASWVHGYQFFKSLTRWTHQPLCLRDCEPFRWLLCGGWSERDLLTQQDATDFCHFILAHSMPRFMSGSWITRVQFLEGAADSHLAFENNSKFAPIMLSFSDIDATHGNLVELIATWHNAESLCRAIDKVGDGVVLMIDRTISETSGKCLQRVELDETSVFLPTFGTADGDIHHVEYRICAITHHIGLSPLSGHYRTLIRYHGHWLHYDDNRFPDVLDHLPETVLQTWTMVWLASANFDAVRTIGSRLHTEPSRTLPMPLHPLGHATSGMDDGLKISDVTHSDEHSGALTVAQPLNDPTESSAATVERRDTSVSDAGTRPPETDEYEKASKRAKTHESMTVERSHEVLFGSSSTARSSDDDAWKP